MKIKPFLIISGILNALWGTAHLFPTADIVRDFGDITADNRNIIRMEWINEGFTLIFIGILTLLVTLISSSDNKIRKAVYFVSSIMLIAMAVLSFFTGFRVDFFPFRMCPFLFTATALPLLIYAIRK